MFLKTKLLTEEPLVFAAAEGEGWRPVSLSAGRGLLGACLRSPLSALQSVSGGFLCQPWTLLGVCAKEGRRQYICRHLPVLPLSSPSLLVAS